MPMIYCKCGCGNQFEKFDKQNRPRKYIYRHQKLRTPQKAILDNMKVNENGCWVWQKYKTKNGHGHVRFKNKTYLAHRFSYQTFRKENIDNKIICHKCNNASCVNPDHLHAATQFDNIQDMVWRGSVNFSRMISEKVIKEMRKLYATDKHTQKKISEMFEINQGYTSKILRNKRRPTEINPNLINEFIGGD